MLKLLVFFRPAILGAFNLPPVDRSLSVQLPQQVRRSSESEAPPSQVATEQGQQLIATASDFIGHIQSDSGGLSRSDIIKLESIKSKSNSEGILNEEDVTALRAIVDNLRSNLGGELRGARASEVNEVTRVEDKGVMNTLRRFFGTGNQSLQDLVGTKKGLEAQLQDASPAQRVILEAKLERVSERLAEKGLKAERDPEKALAYASQATTPPDMLTAIAKRHGGSSDFVNGYALGEQIGRVLLSDPRTPAEGLLAIVKHMKNDNGAYPQAEKLLQAIIDHPNTSPAVLAGLASLPQTTASMLEGLAPLAATDRQVRMRLLENPETPVSVLKGLIELKNPQGLTPEEGMALVNHPKAIEIARSGEQSGQRGIVNFMLERAGLTKDALISALVSTDRRGMENLRAQLDKIPVEVRMALVKNEIYLDPQFMALLTYDSNKAVSTAAANSLGGPGIGDCVSRSLDNRQELSNLGEELAKTPAPSAQRLSEITTRIVKLRVDSGKSLERWMGSYQSGNIIDPDGARPVTDRVKLQTATLLRQAMEMAVPPKTEEEIQGAIRKMEADSTKGVADMKNDIYRLEQGRLHG